MLTVQLVMMRDEAERLLAAHDGCHDLRHAVGVVRGYVSLAEMGDDIDVAAIERVLVNMRIFDKTGKFPKQVTSDLGCEHIPSQRDGE